MHHAFAFHTHILHALPSGALYWPSQRLLCVSDLHLGKSERLARRGGTLLPPYETRDTLTRLTAVLQATGAQTVVCLGDSFDDTNALSGLDEADRLTLISLAAGRHWVWITGNHDPGPLNIAGSHLAELQLGGLSFRHIAENGARAEISGHYHPKAWLTGRGWPCFVLDANRIIMPAFGTYTGGLWTHDPSLTALMQPGAVAVLCGTQTRVIPMPRKPATRR